MSQKFSELLGSGIIRDDRVKINENFAAVASDFAGTAFPTSGIEIGMTCYRTDLKRVYRYVEENVWKLEIDFSGNDALVAKAENAASADKLSNAVNINGVSFDGSKDINTTKWGAARTLRVQDNDGTNIGAEVSVDGSKDAVLKLPVNIKANVTGNVTGSLKGNADTATKATQDKNGAQIDSTYTKLVDGGYWKAGEAVTVGTVRFLKGAQYAGYYLKCTQAGTTGTTQPAPSVSGG